MAETIKILSDYTPADSPNILTIHLDEQGDIHFWTYCDKENDDRVIRLANTGTRHRDRHKIREAVIALIAAYQVEVDDSHCHPDIKYLNQRNT